VIGIQYYFLRLFSVFIGMALSLLMRFQMVHPEAKVSWFASLWPTSAAGGMMTPELYLSLMTMHGTIMVFFVLTTVPQSGFGNYFLPIQIGAEDMAFPVLNMMSFWTTFVALVVMVAAFFVKGGAPLAGWTAYPPLSAVRRGYRTGRGHGTNLWVMSIAFFCGASLMGAINFIATTHRPALPANDADAHAAHLLDLARYRHPRAAWFRGLLAACPAFCSTAPPAQLLLPRGPDGQRSDS
jgi:cytochrome c oxidase subunit 1